MELLYIESPVYPNFTQECVEEKEKKRKKIVFFPSIGRVTITKTTRWNNLFDYKSENENPPLKNRTLQSLVEDPKTTRDDSKYKNQEEPPRGSLRCRRRHNSNGVAYNTLPAVPILIEVLYVLSLINVCTFKECPNNRIDRADFFSIILVIWFWFFTVYIGEGFYFLLILLKCMDIESNPGPLNAPAKALLIPSPSSLTPLHQAATNNDAEEVGKFLLQGHNPNAINNINETPLHPAARNGNLEVARKLLIQGADPNASDIRNTTPLHLVVDSANFSEDRRQLMNILLLMGSNINATKQDGETALSIATRHKNIEAVTFLLQKGANVEAVKTQDGWNLLHIAAEVDFGAILPVLEQAASSFLQTMASTQTVTAGLTPLHVAILAGSMDFAMKLLEKNLYSIALRDTEGRSPLHLAVLENHLVVVPLLVEKGWNVNEQIPASSTTCLHLATLHNNIPAVQMLLNLNANKNALDHSGCTPHQLAVANNFAEVAALLQENPITDNAVAVYPSLPAHNNIENHIQEEPEHQPDWNEIRATRTKNHLLPKEGMNLNMKLALHRYFTYPADYDVRAEVLRADLCHSGFFFVHDYRSLQCYCCTYEIKSLVGWKNITLEAMNKRHAVESKAEFGACCPLMAGQDVGDVPISNPTNYIFEAHRLYSFLSNHWPNRNVLVYDLARFGFYFTGQDDNCRCHFCKLEVRGWEPGDTAEQEHRRWNPRCMFLVNKADTDNIDIGRELAAGSLSDDAQNPFIKINLSKYGSHIRFASYEKNWVPIELLGITLVGDMKYRQFSTLQSRNKSFADWPRQLSQTPDILAMAGFFYTGSGDRVLCFQCGGGLKDWDPKDSPWIEHAKWFGSCPYLNIKKGKDYINHIVHHNSEPEVVTTDSCRGPEGTGNMTCSICKKLDVNCVSLPCGHMTTCVGCVEVERYCNRCHAKRSAHIEVFL